MWAEMFNALDEDHNGFVDIDELKDDMATVLKGETRTPEELMAETDTNGDGHVDFEGG
jgi:Ca2+-binding EF-hand superfamily protein